ncbi:MAG: GAF domain-containing protein [Actinobacteria bacterium]|nr:MAG: GAF domain-containing protein [Actinomycetota bacterium]
MATQDVERRAPVDAERPFAEELDRLRLLLEASSTILGSLDVEAMLPRVLALAQRTLAADAHALWHYDAAADSWRVAAHSGLSDEYVASAVEAIRGQHATVPLDAPIIAEDIATTDWLTPEHRRAHAAEGTRSMMALPLRYGEHVLGTLAFYYRAPHALTEAEKSSALLLANLAAAAMGTAQLYQEQRQLAIDRTFVAEASELLASSLDYETTLSNLASLAVPGFADWCAIDMVARDGSIERLAVAHVDPDKVRWAKELAEKYPPDPNAPYGVANVIRTLQPQLLSEIPEDLLRVAVAERPELHEILQELGLKSSLCVPLVARDRALGAITFVLAERGRRYGEAQLATALDLARHAAIAVDNALLFRGADAARVQARESLAVLDSVFAAAPVGMALMDTAFRYVRVNEALARMNGLPADEHFGRTLRDVLGDEVASEIEPLHRRVLESGEPILDQHVHRELPGSTGETRDSLVSYYPVRTMSEEPIGVGVVITDVTERERARAAVEAVGARLSVLAEASERLASTLDYETTLAELASLLVPDFADWYAVDVLDDDGRFRRLEVVHKDPAKAIWGERSKQLYAPERDESEGTARVVRTGEAALYRTISDELLVSSTKDAEHYRILHELGMESAMVVPLTAAARTFGALMLVSADPARLYDEDDLDFAMHLARRAAVAVDNARLYREAEERARAALVVEHVADGVVLVERDGIIRLWNPAIEHMTGLTAAETLGCRADDVFVSWPQIGNLAETGALRPQTQPVEINGRELWLSITAVGFEDGTVFAFRDLTAERAVETLKSDFVSTVSHELRTPLAAIYGAALTLRREDVPLGEPQRSGLLEVIASESDRLARIVNDILWASRLESGTMHTTIERCDGVELAGSVLDAARHYAPPSIEFELEAPEATPLIAADPDKARQVLTNLVDNAVKYSPDGGTVLLEITLEGPLLRFAVSDEGLGVPPTEHRRIFEKFYRLDPDLTRGVGGTGLGLYISRELLERMGGRIWVESSGTGGSKFVAELPVAV